jgi:hypothetical protein
MIPYATSDTDTQDGTTAYDANRRGHRETAGRHNRQSDHGAPRWRQKMQNSLESR